LLNNILFKIIVTNQEKYDRICSLKNSKEKFAKEVGWKKELLERR